MIDQQIEIERHVPTNIAKLATHKLKTQNQTQNEHRQEHSQSIESNRANYKCVKEYQQQVQCNPATSLTQTRHSQAL